MSYNSSSIADLLMATLFSGQSTKTFYRILQGREFQKYKQNSIQVTLSRLHQKKLVTNSPSGWSLTKNGKNYYRNILHFSYLSSPFKEDAPSTTIISFDIPEPNRKIRNWLRNQIKIFGYKMIHQSLWIGPGPLPTSFVKRMEKLQIRDQVKIFSRVKKNT